MATSVIMPALELAQETGKVIRWLKAPGDAVAKGEPLLEIETDKVTTEIEAPASGILMHVSAQEGDVVPVGQAIAQIGAPGEAGAAEPAGSPPRAGAASRADGASIGSPAAKTVSQAAPAPGASPAAAIKASPLARKIAEQHGVDLGQVKTSTGRIEKADVLAYVEARTVAVPTHAGHENTPRQANGAAVRLDAASPKARRLAAERGLDIHAVRGSGPHGAVLAADVLSAPVTPVLPAAATRASDGQGVGAVWRIMAERMTASWTTAPHFYLFREVTVGRLAAWRQQAEKQTGGRITYTDVLVKLVAAALARHPAVNASWRDGAITRHAEINIGLAVAVEDGLIVPVIHRADTLGLAAIAARREDVVSRGQGGKLRPPDIQGGSFTISNLGMFGVDAFNAIVNPPQAAILAVGRIADRVVALDGQPAVQPTMMLTLSCDHRALDGARAARFLGDLADLIEEPLALLV
jgi:pyruvate dehydrogenase E2 component (dihydrolipoamide acetyltransferase)